MTVGAELLGTQISTANDKRITKIGRIIRKYRLDEIAQLFDVIQGTMSFVGVRPEVPKYVEKYTKEMLTTLLLPAEITNLTSISFSDEANQLSNSLDVDKTYSDVILPQKMRLNLQGIVHFSITNDLKMMVMTLGIMVGIKPPT